MNSNSSQHKEISRYVNLLVSLNSGSVDLLSQSEPFVLHICMYGSLLSLWTVFTLCTLLDPLYLLEVLSFTRNPLSVSWIVTTVCYGLFIVITLSSCTTCTLCTLLYPLVSWFTFLSQSVKDCT